MGFQQPHDLQPAVLHMGDHLVGRGRVRAPRRIVEIQHRVDDRAGVRAGVFHHVGDGVGGRVEKRRDLGGGALGGGNVDHEGGSFNWGGRAKLRRARRFAQVSAARGFHNFAKPFPATSRCLVGAPASVLRISSVEAFGPRRRSDDPTPRARAPRRMPRSLP